MNIKPTTTAIGFVLCLSVVGSLHAELMGEPVPLPGAGTTGPVLEYGSEIPIFTESQNFYAEITCCPEAVEECCTASTPMSQIPCDRCPNNCEKHCHEDECDEGLCSFCCCHQLCCKICPQSCGIRFYPDMPSHVPYYPVNNGYYYFRPYNYFHVARQREEAVQMGLNYNAPYSQAPFEEIYREMESSYDFPNEESEAVYHQRVQELPNLQNNLKTQ